MEKIKIYTLGTSNRSLDDFLDILKSCKIKIVIDIRRWPTSKIFPHFTKENLEKVLKEKGIEYFHIEKLGGYREGGYENYTKTREFKEGLKKLIEISQIENIDNSKEKNLVMICAEKFSWKCHRIFITRELEKMGYRITHIIDKDRIWDPKKEPKEIKPKCEKGLISKK